MFAPPKPLAPPKIERQSYREWSKGVITAFDDARTPSDALRAAGNVILDMDGTIRPRPSLSRYGTQPTGTILGETFEFVKVTSSAKEKWLINLQNVSGTTKAYISKDGGAWTVCNGKTYDNTANAHFCQIDDKVLIMNGEDNLSYLDIPTSTVIPFTSLSTPSAPTMTTNTGLSGSTDFSVYYAITANSTVGETAASPVLTVQVEKDRDYWDAATESIKISWSAVGSAESYNIYLGTVNGGPYYLIAQGVNSLTYTDNGTAQRDVSREAPVSDSTAGPKVSRGTVINGQVFMVGDKDNPRYVWFGGTGTHVLDFSPANGGGNTELGKGGKEFPVVVKPFRDGRGNAKITVLCQGTNGSGKRYNLSPATTSIGTTVIDFMDVEEDNGQDGTDSPDGVLLYNDSLWYPSRDGFKTTGTRPQLQNLLSTNRVSNTIQTDIKNLNNTAMSGACGLGFEGKLYWALPVGSSTNNEIWILDLDKKGAWMKSWSIACDWMMLYNDNDGTTHFLIFSNNVMYELNYTSATNDDGEAFTTSASSGILKFSDDGQEWAKVLQVIFVLLRPQGQVTVQVSGKTEDNSLSTIGGETYDPATSVAGWGEDEWGSFGWEGSDLVPTAFGDARAEVPIEIDEELKWWKWDVSSDDSGVDYQLSDVIIEFVRIGTKDES